MKSASWPRRRVSIFLAAILGGCAQRGANQAFTVQQIDSAPAGRGTVRVKLTTPGAMAEADESLLVNYVRIIAVREATKRQRQVADERARAAFSKMSARLGASGRHARYLAVATEPSPASPKNRTTAATEGTRSIMIWDTQSQAVVGNNVYDVDTPPAVGTVARFETYSAEYVGSGL